MLKPYTKKSEYSYALGVSPTIELLTHRTKSVTQVILNPKGEQNSGVEKIREKCAELEIPIEINLRLVEKLSSNENTYSVAVFKKYTTALNDATNHVVLVNPSDMGNLGTICRTMLAFNFIDLVLIKPAVDIFDPKVVRASMGAVFGINFKYFDSFAEYMQNFNRAVYTFSGRGNILLPDAKFVQPCSLVFGNEGAGLGSEFDFVGTGVRIPQSSLVDSFNLSVAVGIGLYGVFSK